MTSGSACGRHPETPAVALCARCGDFVCADCLEPEGGDHCRACRERVGPARTTPVAWERPGVSPPRGFVQTIWDFLADGRGVLRRAPVGSVGAAGAYLLAWCGLVSLLSIVVQLAAPLRYGQSAPTLSGPEMAGVVLRVFGLHGVLGPALTIAAYWLGVRAAGGRTTVRAAAWTVPYLYALTLGAYAVILSLSLVQPLFTGIGTVLWVWACVNMAVRLSFVAVERDGVRSGRGWVAGWLPLVILTSTCLCGAAMWQLVANPP